MSSFISQSAQAMVVTRDPTDAEIARFICTRNTMQMSKLVQGIQAPASQATFTAALLVLPSTTSGHSSTPEKAKKALNAFVGFRCYYIAIPAFKQWPMKKLSHLLALLWEADPNKSLWSLMTKAWSAVRDRIGKDRAPLDEFFRIICDYLNMPLPEIYLELHGWTLTVNKEGDPTLTRDEDTLPASSTAGLADTAVSVEDLIAYSQLHGYAQGFVVDPNHFSPTFLATGKRDLPEVPRAPVDGRMVARNKRRARRQTARENGLESLQTLEQDLANARAFQLHLNPSDADLPESENHSLYDAFSGILTGNDLPGNDSAEDFPGNNPADDLAGNDAAENDLPDIDLAGNDYPSADLTDEDWNAFRMGANANVTLPPFGDATIF